MKKTKIEERFERAINAFFEETVARDMDSLAFAGNHEIAQLSQEKSVEKTADKFWSIIKQFISFVPGVLFLHILTFGAFQFGVSLWSLFFLISGIVMIWMGMGDLKNKKHILLPISSLIIGLIFSIPFSFLSPLTIINIYVYIYIGILPLMFMAPVLTKGILEHYEEA